MMLKRDKEHSTFQMEKYIRLDGKMIKCMELELSSLMVKLKNRNGSVDKELKMVLSKKIMKMKLNKVLYKKIMLIKKLARIAADDLNFI